MALRRGFKAEANRVALRVREQMGLALEDPVDPWQICEHFEITVMKLSDLTAADGGLVGGYFFGAGSQIFSAFTMSVRGRRLILHNDGHSQTRQRSNIAHELAHCFLGHPLATPLLSNGERECDSVLEEEAAFSGGAILIPNEAAFHIRRTSMVAATAAARYGVSSSMLSYRLRVSGANVVAERSARRAASSMSGA